MACNKKASGPLSTDALDSLKLTYQQIEVELEQVWIEMMMDDDGKLENMRRILQEISYSTGYNRLTFDSLSNSVEALAKLRYDQQTMSESDLISLYDTRTTETMDALAKFTTQLPQFEQYPLMGTLLQEIFEADDRVLQFRIHYDNAAKDYNNFIAENEPYLQQVTNQASHQIKGLFELPE